MDFSTGYYHALDKYGELPPIAAEKRTDIPLETPGFETSLGPQEIGTNVNPFQHPIQAMEARLREGVGKIEFEFFGAGKGTKERFTPETFGTLERQDLKALAEINQMKTSVHGTVGITGMAGLGRQGFDENTRREAITEIMRAVDFAADVTQGGAVVLHTGEWQRPISEADWNKKKNIEFEAYKDESKKATLYVVRSDTGKIISDVSKDQIIYEPTYWTAEMKAKYFGFKKMSDGKYEDAKGRLMDPHDYVDINGEFIDPIDHSSKDKRINPEALFKRVPDWDEQNFNFRTVPLKWEDIERKKDWFNQRYGTGYKAEEFFARTQVENQILQAKGHSLFYARHYEDSKKMFDEAKAAYEYYKKLEESLGPEEAKQLAKTDQSHYEVLRGFEKDPTKLPSEIAFKIMKGQELDMRHIHEASAAADVQAKTHEDLYGKVTTIKDYGLQKSAETIAQLGIFAMEKTAQKKLKDPLYIAPENWHPLQYGSHPQELREIVTAARAEMTKQLATRYGEAEAKRLAEDHIKATFDIGHLNTWRKHFKRNPGESLEETDKRFNKWMLDESEKLAKDKIIGHIHLSDNMGYDDEHLTPGQGNVPMKAFMKKMEELGFKDFLIETGSFNAVTSIPDTLSYFGSPVYGGTHVGVPRQFSGFQQQHFGYQAPPNYIVGAYSPSNEWKLWSEVPFE